MSTTQKSTSGSTLVEIATDLQSVIDGGMVFDAETGEVYYDPSNLDDLKLKAANKFMATKMYAEQQRAQAKSLKDLAKALTDSAKAMERKAERMDDYMLQCAKAAGGEIDTESITVKVRKCPPSVQVLEEAVIPEEYWTEKTVRSINKTLIGSTIKAGGFVPGACLVQNEKVDVK